MLLLYVRTCKYECLHRQTDTSAHPHTQRERGACTYTPTHTHTHKNKKKQTCIQTHIQNTHSHKHTQTQKTHIQTHIQKHTHTCTYKHTHTHTHCILYYCLFTGEAFQLSPMLDPATAQWSTRAQAHIRDKTPFRCQRSRSILYTLIIVMDC